MNICKYKKKRENILKFKKKKFKSLSVKMQRLLTFLVWTSYFLQQA